MNKGNSAAFAREDFRRDGLSANFFADEKAVLAAADALPGGVINIGYPGICHEEATICEQILAHAPQAAAELAVVGHSRKDHITLLSKLTAPHENSSANIWVPVSDKFIGATINRNPFAIRDYIVTELQEWHRKNERPIDVALADCFSEEQQQRIRDWSHRFIDAGARRIIICDTTGRAKPQQVTELFAYLAVAERAEMHPHNDNKMGVMKALAATTQGARYIGTAMYGSGERRTMIDAREFGDALVNNKNAFEKFDEIYRKQVGNPEEILEQVYGSNVIVTGTQWRLRNRDASLEPRFGVTSDAHIAEIVLQRPITATELAILKDTFLYKGKAITLSGAALQERAA